MEPAEIEKQIIEKGLTSGDRVSHADITALVKQLTYETIIVPNTNTTVVYALLDGFTIASGISSCVDAANFDATLGESIAKNRAIDNATDELWRLEGYRLHRALRSTK